MHEWIPGLGIWKKNSCFVKADLAESTEELMNPARGWYQIYTFLAEQEPDFEELIWCLHPKDTLALVLVDIGYYRDRDLDQVALERIRRIISFFSERSYDCIVRVSYDHEGKALEREPFLFSQVKAHLEQIGAVIGESAGAVFVFQGMLVGNWGEMHSSRFLSKDHLQELAAILRRCKGEETYLAVRRPVYWRMLHWERKGMCLESADGMGIFDDGILGSESNLGTFGTESRKSASWNSPWNREDELYFESEIGEHAPNGGEVVYSRVYLRELDPVKVLDMLCGLQATYLNRAHDTRMLEAWKQWKYPGADAWKGKSLFDYVSAHLGYRFFIREVLVTKKRKLHTYYVRIEIENTGFAGCYQEAEIRLEFTDERHRCSSQILECRMKGWKSRELRVLECIVEAGNGRLLLSARRKRDGALIRFGNVSDQDGKVFLGHIRDI